ncbi:hypothetical protein [Dankookia sp. P2]|uniref:hypothetical protein n=1 Tax=Dankookia sp. P2 TaxID=3423955 RepID=UPI003D67ABEE
MRKQAASATVFIPLVWREAVPKRFTVSAAPGLLRRWDSRTDLEQVALPLPKPRQAPA